MKGRYAYPGQRNRLGWCALLPLLLPACMFVHGSIRQEDALDPEKVKAVVAGKTRRADLLALLGPPEAIVRKGEGSAPMPPPAAAPLFPAPRGAAEAPEPPGGGGGERRGYLALFAAEDARRIVKDRLWVLVDDGTGLVEAVVWRPGEGLPQAAPGGSP